MSGISSFDNLEDTFLILSFKSDTATEPSTCSLSSLYSP